MEMVISLFGDGQTATAAAAARILKPTAAQLRQIAKDAVGFAESLKVNDLMAIIRYLNAAYHDKGKSPVSDQDYDELKDVLRARKPNASVLKEVGAAPSVPEVKGGRKKVHLPHPMYSLDKIKGDKPEDVEEWLDDHPGPYLLSDKLDGLSLELVYTKGKLTAIYTRGNGTVGQDVSHLIGHIKVPMTLSEKKDVVIRAEGIITEADFKSFLKSGEADKVYENARNLSVGVVNRLNSKSPALKYLQVLAHEVIHPRSKPSEAYAKLKAWGFKTPANKVYKTLSPAILTKLLASRKLKSKFGIDGLVIEQDKKTVRPPPGTHHPDYAVAFKVNSEDNFVKVKVKEVEWRESKHSYLKPRIIIPPTRLAGVTVEYATGHNAFFIVNGFSYKDRNKGLPVRHIGPGAEILVTRSGEVIPYVVSVEKGAKKPALPKGDFTWTANKVDIYMKAGTSTAKAKRITFFFKSLGVENLAESTVTKLISIGLDSEIKIIRASASNFLAVPGFQTKSAAKLHQSIHSKLDNIPLAKLMGATGLFGRGIGEKKLKPLVEAYPKLMDPSIKFSKQKLVSMALQIDGFSDTSAEKFAQGFPKFKAWYKESKLKAEVKAKKPKVTGSALKGQAVLMTGFRSAELEALVIKNGGTIASSAKTATILLAKDPNGSSSKLKVARDRGIPVLTEQLFRRRYKLSI